MPRRRLTPDEITLWRQVNAQTVPFRDPVAEEGAEPARPVPPPKPKPKKPPAVHGAAPGFRIGQTAVPAPAPHDLKRPVSERLNTTAPAMDRKAYARMRRGKLTPEARIDLHGMTLERAHPALIRFILTAQAEGRRLVLVITGKGRGGTDDDPVPRPRGILKQQVPDWLSRPPVAQAVLQVAQAHVSHGGSGAYYVYLRRPRGAS